MRFIVLFLGLVLLTPAAIADDAEEFNSAWRAYTEALANGDTEQKIEAAASVLAAGEVVFEPTDPRLVVLNHNYGALLLVGGQKEDAQRQLKKALKLGEAVYGENSPKLVKIIADYADSEAELFVAKRQLILYRRALQILEEQYGEKSVEVADMAFRAGTTALDKSSSTDGERYLVQAREIYASLPDPAPRKIGLSDFYLGKISFAKRSYRRSAEYLSSALGYFDADDEQARSSRLITMGLLVQALESVGKSEEATQYCVAIGKERPLTPNQEYLPVFRMAPEYPSSMLASGREGFVDIEFTVDESGFVRDPTVMLSLVDGKRRSRIGSFDKAALDAVMRFRYAPRFEDGEAVVAEGVTTRISFMLED